MFKKIFRSMRKKAENMNRQNILGLLESQENARFLDLGCDDGVLSQKLAAKIGTKDVYGLEIVDERLKMAIERGVIAKKGDLNASLDYEDNYFDSVHANQVIEHLYDTDNFVKEIHRILKKGGYCVISTENLASWVNIFALLLGWQPFSLTNISNKKLGLGNPFALNAGGTQELSSWLHIRVMAVRALKELFEVHGFKVEKVTGAGYFPLPSIIGKWDVRHSHFITVKARKL